MQRLYGESFKAANMSTRLSVRKTYKLFVNGAFIRSESGKVLPARTADGTLLDNFSQASRKDLREAVRAAHGAWGNWSKKSAYLRGQILYRAAEMLEHRGAELAAEIARSTGAKPAAAQAEVDAAVDRLVYYAGWTDKYAQLFGSVNPVASSHFNFTTPEPMGVVGVLCPDQPSLLALVSLVAPVILSGNAAVVLASEAHPLPALTFAEILATSDLSAGVLNLLAGRRAELLPHFATHMEINAVVDGAGLPDVTKALQEGTGLNLKRIAPRTLEPGAWTGNAAENPYWILDTVEYKTAWHPIGV